jgi:hypothetical protein
LKEIVKKVKPDVIVIDWFIHSPSLTESGKYYSTRMPDIPSVGMSAIRIRAICLECIQRLFKP